MRLCRFRAAGDSSAPAQAGLYDEKQIVPLAAGARAYADATHEKLDLPAGDDLIALLPPDGAGFEATRRIAEWVARAEGKLPAGLAVPTDKAELLVPVPKPNKLLLLAGNFASHIEEGGREKAREREETFPYVFMKPASTTLTNPGVAVRIPTVSPNFIDWELELAVVIGRRAKGVKEADALGYVAGYTVVNDISNRKFRPNPSRVTRERDAFFDWLHGKWHDSFCPCGPCVTSADAIPDPQVLEMKLRLNGEIRQDGSSAMQIFPVAAVIEFVSNIVTLEPGDIISTGTLAGVGSATGTFLKPGDKLEASIGQIGTLVSSVEAE
jgi:2-keto-4-pentenoate hydratase/2-oxohepta-3-ene-1,7-dioic acid hydratase in catechol pathway